MIEVVKLLSLSIEAWGLIVLILLVVLIKYNVGVDSKCEGGATFDS